MLDGRNWYDVQKSRRYPLDDQATGEGDDGSELPIEFLSDIRVVFPSTLGSRARLGSARSSAQIKTLTVVSDTGVPLAAYSVRARNAIYGRTMPLVPLHPEVSGWVVLGGQTPDFSVGFSSVASGGLSARAAIPVRARDVSGIGKYGIPLLTQVPEIRGSDEVEVVADDRLIDGKVRRCIVVKLKDGNGPNSPAAKYRGTCTGRPESKTCNPPAIETINGVSPANDGRLAILLKPDSFWKIYPGDLEPNILALDADLDFGLACPPPRVPDENGTLPYEVDGNCGELGPTEPIVSFPVDVNFSSPGPLPLSTMTGGIVHDSDNGRLQVEKTTTLGTKNLAAMILSASGSGNLFPVGVSDTAPLYRKASVYVQSSTGIGGGQGGIMFGWRQNGTKFQAYFAGISHTGLLTLDFWTGTQMVNLRTVSLSPATTPAAPTELRVVFSPNTSSVYAVQVSAIDQGSGISGSTTYTATSIKYQPGDGYGCWGTQGVWLDNFHFGNHTP